MKKQTDSQIALIKPDKKRKLIERLIAYFERERGENIGVIAAEDMIDFILDIVGKDIYNNGVDETTRLIQDRLGGVWIDVEAMVKKS